MDLVGNGTLSSAAVQSERDLTYLRDNLNDFFLTIMGSIVLFLQAGFAFLEAGLIRKKNTTSMLLKNYFDSVISCVFYWLIGYAFAYGDGNGFIGHTYFALTDLSRSKYSHWFFQYAFAATSSTIVSGSVAERTSMIAYFTYTTIMSGFIYPVISHWSWSENGWLKSMGFVDFAGSGVVHLTGGASSVVAVYFLGPRIGRTLGGEFKDIPGHSIPHIVLGAFILILGFLAFNGGSQGSIIYEGDGIVIARAVSNTVFAGSGGAITALFFNRFVVESKNKQWSCLMAINGSLIGMVSICAGCNQYSPFAAVCIGVIAALVYIGLHSLLPVLNLDDPIDAIPVHFGGGLWGLLALPLFHPTGILLTWSLESGKQLLYNLTGAVAICVWSWFLTGVLFTFLKIIGFHRIKPDVEIMGLDWAVHREPAYPYESDGVFSDKIVLANRMEISELIRPATVIAWSDLSVHDERLTEEGINPAFYM